MQEYLDIAYGYLTTYGLRIIAAVLIFLIGRWVAKIVARLIERFMLRAKIDATLTSFVKNLAYFALLTFVIIAAVDKLGVKTTSLVAIIGAAGLAVGLALQGSLSNLGAGVLLILFKPFKVGDFVEAGGTMGTVEKIQIFNTILAHPDNRRIIVPNSAIIADKITNFSDIDKRRIDMVFGISYDDNIKTAKEVLERLVASDSRILKEPATVIAVSELGDSSVNFAVRPWVNTSDYWDVYFDTNKRIKEALDAAGVSIPCPQRDVHLYNETT